MAKEPLNGYELSRIWFDWCFNNPDQVKPYHTAIYFFAIEQCNRLGWKEVFGFPTSLALEATGIKSYSAYKRYFDDLAEWGFFVVKEYAKNQFTSNIIALTLNDKAHNKALDKATIKANAKQLSKQYESIGESNYSIDKPLTIEQLTINQEPEEGLVLVSEIKKKSPDEIIVSIVNEILQKKYLVLDKKKAAAILKIYSEEKIRIAVSNAKQDPFHIESSFKHLSPEFFTRPVKIERFLNFIPNVTKSNSQNDALRDATAEAIRLGEKNITGLDNSGKKDSGGFDLPYY